MSFARRAAGDSHWPSQRGGVGREGPSPALCAVSGGRTPCPRPLLPTAEPWGWGGCPRRGKCVSQSARGHRRTCACKANACAREHTPAGTLRWDKRKHHVGLFTLVRSRPCGWASGLRCLCSDDRVWPPGSPNGFGRASVLGSAGRGSVMPRAMLILAAVDGDVAKAGSVVCGASWAPSPDFEPAVCVGTHNRRPWGQREKP